MVNCAPPSGPILRPDPAAFDGQQPARNPEPHARARRLASSRRRRDRTDRRGAAGRPARCPGRGRAPGSTSPSSVTRACTLMVEPGRRVLGRRSPADARARSRSAAGRAAPARPDRRARRADARCSVCSTWSRAAATISEGCAQRGSAAIAPASMRAISRMFWKSRVRRSTSARIRSLCSTPVVGGQPRGLDVARGDANGRERRAQVVAERRQQRRLQLLALACQLGRLALLEKLRAFDRDRDDAAERVERARPRSAGRRRRAGRWAWCRPAAGRAES